MLEESRGTGQRNLQRNRKRFLLVVVYVAMLLPWIVPAAHRTLTSNTNSPLDWVDGQFRARQQYDQFYDQFGAGDHVVISWHGCTIDESKLDDFVRTLLRAPAFQQQGHSLFHGVDSGRAMVMMMNSPPLSIDRADAIDRLTGSIIGPDGQTTCVVIGFTKEALMQRTRLVPLICAAARQTCGVAIEDQHLAGPIMDGYEVDRATRHTIQTMAPLSSLVLLLICYLCLDSLTATLLVFGVSVFCQAVTLAMVDLTGGTMTALMSVLAPLIQVLAIAGGIHFINYYFDAQQDGQKHQASKHAFRIAWLPCLLSSVTTAIGLGSLGVSGLVAVREFGFYAAFGVLVTVVSLLTFLPGFCSIRPIKRFRHHRSLVSDSGWRRLAAIIGQRSTAICGLALLLMVALGIGVQRLDASVRIETLFKPDSRLISDYAWIESQVGSLVPIEVVVGFDEANQSPTDQLNALAAISEKLRQIPKVNAVVSPLTFSPEMPPAQSLESDGPLLELTRGSAEQFNLCSTDERGHTQWRTTAYVSALGDNDYLQILSDIDASLEDQPTASLEVSGLMPLVHGIQHQLLHDLFSSFLVAFALIAIVMTMVQAGVISGLLSMIPNVFPALTLFGLLGWLERPLDIGTIMTASVAMGIAVDDTLHFLAFYHRALEAGATRLEAVTLTYQHCARAMIQTTVICGGGLSLFILSDFVPTAGFAWMSVLLLVAALVGDLIVLPAILLSPLGGGRKDARPHQTHQKTEQQPGEKCEHQCPEELLLSGDDAFNHEINHSLIR